MCYGAACSGLLRSGKAGMVGMVRIVKVGIVKVGIVKAGKVRRVEAS